MKKLWFKDKEYGWGWRPQTWEGWAVTVFFVFLLAIRTMSLLLAFSADPSEYHIFAYSVDIFGLIVLLLIIAFATGERPHWRWGGEKVKASFAIEQTLILMLFLIVTFAAGFFGSSYTVIDTWYADLVTSPLTPPHWVFPIVWSFLYLLMGLSAYFSWYHIKAHRTAVLVLYGANLALNVLWSYAFFTLHDIGFSVAVILLLDLVVLTLTLRFLKWWPPSGYLLLPYLAWLFFTTYLNISIFLLN